jgi:hypothetical protein
MLNRLWEAWKKFARRIGDFQARVLLTVIYAVVVLPFGVIIRTFEDPLRIRRSPQNGSTSRIGLATWFGRGDNGEWIFSGFHATTTTRLQLFYATAD